ncbi:MAG: DUF4224 domain-containing protein [Acidovorax sp.]|uniref:DUF4224 domain-containing protein n=1 Tax=Acidovorax sp. TaxID=1872122 RepID=UPI003918D1D1
MTPDLTDDEIDSICAGLSQNAAKVRYLRGLGLRVDQRPNGRPLVARAEWERHYTNRPALEPVKGSTTPPSNGPRWKTAAAG